MCFAYYDLHSSYCAFICMHECIYSGEPHLEKCGVTRQHVTQRHAASNATLQPSKLKSQTVFLKVILYSPYGPCYLQTVPSTYCLRSSLLNRTLKSPAPNIFLKNKKSRVEKILCPQD